MATVPQIDVNQVIVEINAELNKNGSPSPYFEELWYTLSQVIAAQQEVLAAHQATLDDHETRLVAGGL